MATPFTATLNFGAIGNVSNEASIVVTGLTGISGTSYVEAWLRNEATAEHPLDDIKYDPIEVWADESTIVAGTGVTIFGRMPFGNAYGNYKVNGVYT